MSKKEIVALVRQGAASSLLIQIGGAGLYFTLYILLARLLGVEQFGTYVYILTLTNVFVMVITLGFDSSLVRYVAVYNAQERWELLKGIIRISHVEVGLLAIVVGIAAAVAGWFWNDGIINDQIKTFWIALLLLPILAIVGIQQSILRGYRKVVIAFATKQIIIPILIGIIAAVTYQYNHSSLTAYSTMFIHLSAAIIALGIVTKSLCSMMPTEVNRAELKYRTREWHKVSIPLLLLSGMSLILNQADIIMLGWLKGAEIAGIYGAVSKSAFLVSFALMAVNTIAAPIIAELYYAQDNDSLQRMVTFSVRWISCFSVVVAVLLLLFGEYILGLFGAVFASGYSSLVILLFGYVISSLSGPVGFLMTMTGHQNDAAIILAAGTTVNLFLNYVLIPKYGMEGAAIATAVSMITWNLIMSFKIRKILGIEPTIFAIRSST